MKKLLVSREDNLKEHNLKWLILLKAFHKQQKGEITHGLSQSLSMSAKLVYKLTFQLN